MKLTIVLLSAFTALSYASNASNSSNSSNSSSSSSSPSSSLSTTASSLSTPLSTSLSPSDDDDDDDEGGFHIDPSLPDGNYRITMRPNGQQPLVKRWSPRQRRWQDLSKRAGTGQYTFLVDDDIEGGEVQHVGLDVHSANGLPIPITTAHCRHLFRYDTLAWPLIQDDYRASKQALFNWCEVYSYKSGHIELALRGNVGVYVCQRKTTIIQTNTCSEAEFKAAEARMNETCGMGPAWVWMRKWNKEYGRAWKGEKACRKWGKLTTNNGEGFPNLDVWEEDDRDPKWH